MCKCLVCLCQFLICSIFIIACSFDREVELSGFHISAGQCLCYKRAAVCTVAVGRLVCIDKCRAVCIIGCICCKNSISVFNCYCHNLCVRVVCQTAGRLFRNHFFHIKSICSRFCKCNLTKDKGCCHTFVSLRSICSHRITCVILTKYNAVICKSVYCRLISCRQFKGELIRIHCTTV